MPSELRDRLSAAKRSKVPNLETSVVRARSEEVRHISIPADNVDILLVRLKAQHRAVLLAQIPHSQRLVRRARREDLSIRTGVMERTNRGM